MKTIQISFKFASALMPNLTSRVALRLFQRTFSGRKRFRKREKVFYENAQYFKVYNDSEDVKVYEMGNPDDPIALLVHGWNSNAGSMHGIANRLVDEGYYVLAPDLPAHGHSKLTHTNLIECSEALKNVLLRLNVTKELTVVTHSFGSAVLTHCLATGHFKVKKILFLSVHNRLLDIFEEYANYISLNRRSYDLMINHAQKIFKTRLDHFTIEHMLNNVRADEVAIIHDEYDKIIPFENALALASGHPGIRLISVSKTGHYRMLTNKEVLNIVSKLLSLRPGPKVIEASVSR